MTVEELIGELMASCQSLDDEVHVSDPGLVTLVSNHTHADGRNVVVLNYYPDNGTCDEN